MEKIRLLLYCNKKTPYLFSRFKTKFFTNKKEIYANSKALSLNGKIVAECDFEVEEILKVKDIYDDTYFFDTPTLWYDDLLKKSCLNNNQIEDYLEFNGYAIHIKNLNIFDKPRELNKHYDKLVYEKGGFSKFVALHNAPQNMMYVYDREHPKDKYILISIRPEWLCKILNGEKTIEVRRKVLKEMINNA